MTDLIAAAQRIVELDKSSDPGDQDEVAVDCLNHAPTRPRSAPEGGEVMSVPGDYVGAGLTRLFRRLDELEAENERLREDIAAAETSAIMWKARCEQAEPRVAELEAERDRLREVLQEVLDARPMWEGGVRPASRGALEALLADIRDIARAALAPAEKPGGEDGRQYTRGEAAASQEGWQLGEKAARAAIAERPPSMEEIHAEDGGS